MINNDILRRLSTIFSLSENDICSIFSLGNLQITTEQLTHFFLEKNDSNYVELLDVEFSSFLNGFIVEKRGPSDNAREAEIELSNNMIFNKVKIALALKADDVIAILASAEVELGKYELSALFRNVHHKHYKKCSDETLSAFLRGLKDKFS